MSAPHCTTTRWPMLKFGGESSSVESGLTSTSSLSNSLMRKSLNSPSNVLPRISFQENLVHKFGVWGWIYSTVNTPSHNLCGSSDLASKLNDVTGDELDIDVSIALFQNQNQTILRWCRCLLIWRLFLQLSPIPSINCTFQQEDTTVVKKFQHILGLCSSSKQVQRKLENWYHASNICMKLEFLLLNC